MLLDLDLDDILLPYRSTDQDGGFAHLWDRDRSLKDRKPPQKMD